MDQLMEFKRKKQDEVSHGGVSQLEGLDQGTEEKVADGSQPQGRFKVNKTSVRIKDSYRTERGEGRYKFKQDPIDAGSGGNSANQNNSANTTDLPNEITANIPIKKTASFENLMNISSYKCVCDSG